jgi:hypothetical protein
MTEGKPIISIFFVKLKDAWHGQSEEEQMESMRKDRQRLGTR